MTFGDKIYARLTLNGKNVVEFIFNDISDMSQLISHLRYITQSIQGLATLMVRNITRGWSLTRPLMLYPAPFSESPNTSPYDIYREM